MISKDDIVNLGALARVEVSESEITSLQKDISNILEYVGQIQAVETGELDLRPAVRNVLRADVPRTEGDPMWEKHEKLVDAFPKHEGTYNVVRKIIQKDE